MTQNYRDYLISGDIFSVYNKKNWFHRLVRLITFRKKWKDPNLLVASHSGIYLFDKEKESFTKIACDTSSNHPEPSQMQAIIEDNHGIGMLQNPVYIGLTTRITTHYSFGLLMTKYFPGHG